MIGKVNRLGSGFRGLISYLETGKGGRQRQRVDWIETRNLPTTHAQTAACIMRATADLSVRTQKPVYHFSISFDPGDPVNRTAMRAVADRVLSDLGLREHQALLVAHRDTSHPHVHVVVNRVHPAEGQAWSNSWDYPRIERGLRSMEAELGLRVVPGKHARVPGQVRPPPERAPRVRPVRGDATFLREVQERAAPVLEAAHSWEEVETGLGAHGLSVRIKARGLCVTDGVREVKASDVGRAFSRARMEARLGPLSSHRRMGHAVAGEVRNSEAQAGRAPGESEMNDSVTSTPAPAPAHQVVEPGQTPAVSMQPLEHQHRREAELRRRVEALREGWREAPTMKPEPEALAPDPAVNAFLHMAERRLQADALNSELRSASEALAEAEGWARALDRSDVAVGRATEAFAREIRGALRDPQRFTAAFTRMPEERKRSLLRTLREQPNAFAREFLDSFGVAEQRPLHPSGWRAALESMADQLSGRTAAAKVFRAPEGVRGTARLLADAGDYYLDMLEARTRMRGWIAAALRLPQGTLAENLREACRSRVAAAERERSNLQLRRDAIDAAPSRRELADRYLRLRPEQRVHVRGASTRLTGLIVDVARLAERMGRGPEHERDGPGL